MNFLIILILLKFSFKGGLIFPLRETHLNPGFEIGIDKIFDLKDNKWGFSLDAKSINLKEISGIKFGVLSIGSFLSFSFLENLEGGPAIFYSLLNLQKEKWSEYGFTFGSCIFLRISFKDAPFFMEGEVDFLKGKQRDLWLFGISAGI